MPLQIIRADITTMRVDAIINTTNEELMGYSGVDLAVHTAAGTELDTACAALAPLWLGEAKLTGGYRLPCKYIIHTAGPIWQGGVRGERALLRSCYTESLKLAVAHGCRSVAAPLIGAGTYGYPKELVLRHATQVISEFLQHHELDVYLCVYDKEAYTFSRSLFADIQAFIDDDYVECHDDAFWYDHDGCDEPIISAPKPKLCANESLPPEELSLAAYVRAKDKGFRETLFDLIDKSGMTDVACYKRANIDKRTFSKIKTSKDYRPSKQTAVALALALELDLEQTQELLATAGMTLSKSVTFDKIIRYFLHKGIYNIFEINEALFEFDQPLLGSL